MFTGRRNRFRKRREPGDSEDTPAASNRSARQFLTKLLRSIPPEETPAASSGRTVDAATRGEAASNGGEAHGDQ